MNVNPLIVALSCSALLNLAGIFWVMPRVMAMHADLLERRARCRLYESQIEDLHDRIALEQQKATRKPERFDAKTTALLSLAVGSDNPDEARNAAVQVCKRLARSS